MKPKYGGYQQGILMKDLRSLGAAIGDRPPEHLKGDTVRCRRYKTYEAEHGTWDGGYEWHYLNLDNMNLVRNPQYLLEGVRTHELKLVQPYFTEVKIGRKRSELRVNDRDYHKGDILAFTEYDPIKQTSLYNHVKVEVTHVLKNVDGLDKRYVILSIKRIK